ncbi:MAG: hypothetical protein DRJ69_05590 [Thermoprotei archaeon]|nr:MAG: hypothetical protein DRJ69_05590 [Thermoprotei archaeon]
MKSRNILLKSIIFYLLFYICRFNFFSIMPLIAEELNLLYTDLAWISSILFIGYAIMLIPAGFLADRYNPSIVLLIGSLISSISNILIALVTGGYRLSGRILNEFSYDRALSSLYSS